jgi:hypothetical protein
LLLRGHLLRYIAPKSEEESSAVMHVIKRSDDKASAGSGWLLARKSIGES